MKRKCSSKFQNRRSYLDQVEGTWVTSMGAWVPGQKVVFRGKSFFDELDTLPWLGLILFAITGKVLPDNHIKMIDALHSMCGSFPEPRLWNNRVAALAGTARSTAVLAMSGATAASEAKVFGKQADILAYDFISRAAQTKSKDLRAFILDELKKRRCIGGFGRPITARDERILPVMSAASRFKCDKGEHLKMVFCVERELKETGRKLKANVGCIAAAICADIGLNVREYNLITTLVFSAGILACYIDASSKPPGSLFPLNSHRVFYRGHGERSWEK